jgi:hypothetical protein
MTAVNTDMYQSLCGSLSNVMQGWMSLAQSRLKEDSELHDLQFEIKPVATCVDAGELFLVVVVEDVAAENKPVLAVRFALHRGRGGVNVGVRVDDLLRQETKWQHMPRNLASDCYTEDSAVLKERIKRLPFATMMSAARETLDRLAGMRRELGDDYPKTIANML